MSALFPVTLSAPAKLVGTVDATRDRATPTPRTIEQAFGPAARGAVVEPMDADEPISLGERAVIIASAGCAAALALLLIAERLGFA